MYIVFNLCKLFHNLVILPLFFYTCSPALNLLTVCLWTQQWVSTEPGGRMWYRSGNDSLSFGGDLDQRVLSVWVDVSLLCSITDWRADWLTDWRTDWPTDWQEAGLMLQSSSVTSSRVAPVHSSASHLRNRRHNWLLQHWTCPGPGSGWVFILNQDWTELECVLFDDWPGSPHRSGFWCLKLNGLSSAEPESDQNPTSEQTGFYHNTWYIDQNLYQEKKFDYMSEILLTGRQSLQPNFDLNAFWYVMNSNIQYLLNWCFSKWLLNMWFLQWIFLLSP